MASILLSYDSSKRSMNGANLSTYVYQGKKKSTQFADGAHNGYTGNPHQGYIIDNQHPTAHIKYTKIGLELCSQAAFQMKWVVKVYNLRIHRDEMLGLALIPADFSS